jgi:hypothetical protein
MNARNARSVLRAVRQRLERRKTRFIVIAVSLLLMAAVIAGSYLHDDEASKDNVVSIATFDLTVNSTNTPGPIIRVPALLPGSSVTTYLPVRLKGSGTGKLSVIFKNIETTQGTQTDSERDAEAALGGEVYDVPNQLYVSVNGGSRSTLKEGLEKTIGILSAGESTYVAITFEAKTTAGDEYQGDQCTMDIVFNCDQQSP